MGHQIEHRDYPENVNKKKVQEDLDNYINHCMWQEGGGSTGGIRWLDHIVAKNYEAAVEEIERRDKGWYDCLAVKFYDPVKTPDTKTMTQLRQDTKKALDLYNERSGALYPASLTSKQIACKNCSSRLERSFLKRNTCPVCGNDLRPEYLLNSIKSAQEKYYRASEREREYMTKHSKKEIRWLVKIEYHT